MSAPTLLSLRWNLPSTSSVGNRLRQSASRTRRRLCVSSNNSTAAATANSSSSSSSSSSSRRTEMMDSGRASTRVGMRVGTQPLSLPRSRLFSSAVSATSPTLFGDTIIVTKRCAERLNELREAKGKPTLKLRLSVEGGGCSGFQYKFALEDAAAGGAAAGGGEDTTEDEEDADSDDEDEDEIDHEFERDGAVLVVDTTSLEFVKGATVDFEEDMMRSAFAVLNNPVSESACGCGSSFALKNFEKNPALD